MTRVTIASIVEGEGEVQALPALLRRVADQLEVWNRAIPTPYRMPRSKLVAPGGIERAVDAVARYVVGAGGVLVLLDADDDCPAQLAPDLLHRATSAARGVPTGVVLANREYEAWFLASAPSLAGARGLPELLEAPGDPEARRGAKEWLSGRMAGRSYKPTADQAALTEKMDMSLARLHSPSFDKLWREVTRLMLGAS